MGGARPIDGPAVSVQYAEGQHGHTAFVRLSSGGPDLLVLNPAMITIDGLLDDPHPRSALTRLGEQRRVTCFDRRGIGLSDPLSAERAPLDDWVADVLLVLDAGGVSEVDLFANFDTGLIALEFAARYPDRVRSLVLAQCFATYLRSDDYPFGLDPITADSLIRDATNPVTPAERLDTVVHAAPSPPTTPRSGSGGTASASGRPVLVRRRPFGRSPPGPTSASASRRSPRPRSCCIGATAPTWTSAIRATSPTISRTLGSSSSPVPTHSGSRTRTSSSTGP